MVEKIEDILVIKDNPILYKIFMDLPCGAAMHQLICDETGKPIDYVTTEVNTMFSSLLMAPPDKIEGSLASDRLSRDELHHWLEIFSPVALTGVSKYYTMFSELNKTSYEGVAVCPRTGYFFVMFITGNMKLPDMSLL